MCGPVCVHVCVCIVRIAGFQASVDPAAGRWAVGVSRGRPGGGRGAERAWHAQLQCMS
jgi:hypothetical protein